MQADTLSRIAWAIPWILFVILIVSVGGLLFTVAVIGFGIVGLAELFNMTRRARPVVPAAYVGLASLILVAHYGTREQFVPTFAAFFVVLFLFAAARERRQNVTYSMAVAVLGVGWIGVGLAHAVLLRDLDPHGGALLVDVLVGTFVGDTCAYGGGRMFGTRRITPRISPNKTMEGLIAGILGGTLAFWFAGLYQDWLSGADALAIGFFVALAAPVGDLFESMIKRDLKVKDTGRIFGPHGGLLDRMDAVLFTLVAGYYVAIAVV
jgi:phosphatidate cytidylyltransferase